MTHFISTDNLFKSAASITASSQTARVSAGKPEINSGQG
jgi:hypothetical protein